jgi:hypothetical protein
LEITYEVLASTKEVKNLSFSLPDRISPLGETEETEALSGLGCNFAGSDRPCETHRHNSAEEQKSGKEGLHGDR